MPGFEFAGTDQIRDEATAWVARFAPLVMDSSVPEENEVRERIELCEKLKQDGSELQDRLSSIESADSGLAATFRQAYGQLDSIEVDLRKQIARLRPGDPAGIADLGSLNDKLAERLARQEVGLEPDNTIPDILEMKVGPGNRATAIGLGVFGLGWNSFTAMHAFFMIGGMAKAFGWAALFLLLFYAIFFMVGIGMFAAAADAGSVEDITLEGRTLTLAKTLGPWVRKKQFELAPDAEAQLAMVDAQKLPNQRNTVKQSPVVQLTDVDGKAINFGTTSTDAQRREIADRINAYLKLKA